MGRVVQVIGPVVDVAFDSAELPEINTALLLTNQAIAAPTTTFSVTGLTAGTTYYYRVRAENGSGSGPNSNSAGELNSFYPII